MDFVIYSVLAIVFAFVIFISVFAAYKTVLRPKDSVARDRRKNADVHLDDVCGSFLKLTNLEDVQVP